ncbi:MerR family transcriptional regulator [Paenibacillus sp. NPDC057886]|uniref:MerR family transcriptional regulator n=1 Tax=Paenibacillus sp. NPDC057886 TaxID=3346270 RepID=UPI0036CE7090
MSKKYYTVGSFAKLTSTPKPTLRYYDRKGLLKPSGYTEGGYRTYTDDDLLRLHQILTLKYLDYPLDEISKYLEQDGKDFHASLELQHELLLQKQQHIQHVVATIERARVIFQDNDYIDPGLIMQMIRSIQHEEEQKQWLSDRLPDALVQSMSLSGLSLDERTQVERKIMLAFNDLLLMSKQGLPPEHHLVQECALTLKLIIEQMFGQSLQEPGTIETLQTLGEWDPQLFPKFDPKLINYLIEALGHLLTQGAPPHNTL